MTTFFTFPEFCAKHIDFFHEHIRKDFSYESFSDRTARAKKPLYQPEDLVSYLALYGLAHYQRLRTLLQGHQFTQMHIQKLCIVDYGCGQGIGCLAYLEHALENFRNIKIDEINIILIEPSPLALERALFLIKKHAKHYALNIKITAYNCSFDDLDPNILQNAGSHIVHIFSNILDIYATGTYDMQKLVHHLQVNATQQYLFAVSPCFNSGEFGFNAMHEYLQPRIVLQNHSQSLLVDEYSAKFSRMQPRYATARFYAAQF